MRLKSLAVAAAAILVSVTSLMAQSRGDGDRPNCDEMAKRRTETLKKEAKLDETQAKSALDIYTKACKGGVEAQKNNDKEAAIKIRKESTDAINALLTPEQAKLWKKYQEQRRDKRKSREGKR